ncbi:PREDICTED: uncharacterized protein LOC105554467 [Mandrillus leucophaeus]|uniref:uncharacterized protein LOC105554467 n=1 Tax=Mandrillus leucophaeus TaxID=9568 RepID=UPI0005F36E4B|nr:PREDICTED: uncharacterized protein LOC105554467 [Mandrillus leucophaeus]
MSLVTGADECFGFSSKYGRASGRKMEAVDHHVGEKAAPFSGLDGVSERGPDDSIALSSLAIAHFLEPRSACSLRRNTPMLLPTTHRPETRIDRSLGWPGTQQAQRKRKVSSSPLGLAAGPTCLPWPAGSYYSRVCPSDDGGSNLGSRRRGLSALSRYPLASHIFVSGTRRHGEGEIKEGCLSGTGSPSPGLPGPARGEDPGNAGRLQTLNGLTLVTSPGKAGRCFHPEGHLLICTRKCCRGSTRANPPVERVPALGARPTGGQRGEVAGRLGSKGRGVGGIEGAVTSGSDTRRTPLKASNFFMGKNGFSFFN